MIKNKRRYYLLNYIFILGILLLFLNDHFFKWEFSNWVTGKLSDFIGLLILPFLLSFIFPKTIKWNVILTGVFFIFWKSPYSQSFIDFYNSITFIEITRVVDYSDLIALPVLPLSYYLLKYKEVLERFYLNKCRLHPVIILLPSIIVCMASSPPHNLMYRYTKSNGNIRFEKFEVKVKMNQDEILKKMNDYKIKVYEDTIIIKLNLDRHNISYSNAKYYRVDKIILEHDTINDLQFSMRPISDKEGLTKIYLNGINTSKNLDDYKVRKKLNKYYKKLIKKYVKESVKN